MEQTEALSRTLAAVHDDLDVVRELIGQGRYQDAKQAVQTIKAQIRVALK